MNFKSALNKVTATAAAAGSTVASKVTETTHSVTTNISAKAQAHRELSTGKDLMGAAMREAMRQAGAAKIAQDAADAEAARLANIAAETQAVLDAEYSRALEVYTGKTPVNA